MNLPQFERFSVHDEPATVGKRWAKYVKRLDKLFTAFAVTDANQQRALFLHYAGPEVSDIFDTLPDTARAYEQADHHAAVIEGTEATDTTVHAVRIRTSPAVYNQRQSQQRYPARFERRTCRNCGGGFPHMSKPCPAKGKTCHDCGKQNHFAKYCLSKHRPTAVKHIQASTSHDATVRDSVPDQQPPNPGQDEHYQFHVEARPMPKPTVTVNVDGTPINAVIDTGASVMMMSLRSFARLQPQPRLVPPSVPVYGYGNSTPLDVRGTFTAKVSYRSSSADTEIYVTSHDGDTLLNFATATALGLVELAYATSASPESVYPDRFTGIGKLNNYRYHIQADSSVSPVAIPHRRIPFHMRRKVEQKLDRLLELDIFEKVENTPTPWVSPITVVPKRDSEAIRICVDMRNVNTVIKRERHIIPTVDDLIASLNGATTFSKLDLNSGYHQIELDEESRQYTVFSTHVGLFRYKRLNFGISSASEIFQQAVQSTFHDLSGVLNISDDILVFGRSQAEHDARLEAVMQRLRKVNLTINPAKCVFGTDRVMYFGHVFAEQGISPDPRKVDAMNAVTEPQNISEMRSFLGMVNYCARFIPDLASISAPLRNLTKADVPWTWGPSETAAFSSIKELVSKHCTMVYFNPANQTEVIVDAGLHGLGAILVQHDSRTQSVVPIALASRSLTPVKQRYSQTEREALAVTWAIRHFHIYLYGGSFVVITDHKPLLAMFNNASSKPSIRIERWLMRLQAYDFEVKYHPGKLNPADYMSRHPQATHNAGISAEKEIAEQHVSFITAHAIPKTVTRDDIVSATGADDVLQYCMRAVQKDNWKDFLESADASLQSEYRSLHEVRDRLTVSEGNSMLLRDHRIVIPRSLRQRIIDIAHEGHQGITKTKALLREKVWFPSIDRLTERTVRDCLSCQMNAVEHAKEPLKMTELPQLPWSEVSVDFANLPSGEHMLVVIDDYSRFVEVEIVSSTAASLVIPKLDRIFSSFGVPTVVRTDNGPPFNRAEFSKFAQYLGFQHRKVTPRWPQANGEVERFMKTLKKVYRCAIAEHKCWKQEVYKFLSNYRATHSTTGVPPATLLFGRGVRTRLPETPSTSLQRRDDVDTFVRDRDQEKKQRMKSYADNRGKTRTSRIAVGDTVLVRRDGTVPKHQSPYLPQPYKVVR
ncbi:PREDICTED: uncharacterized protein K02A2.6-like [Priapulus caudatus]|uniref:RNA-directed DNA polymerase n=1 Tax=Priapulus caudatus TaxID=37621 RepID=A0ABM1DW77_PRICU|nr:PREDICTED: uncharacterized protein K02A2.6-like [Priapulus caudatus]